MVGLNWLWFQVELSLIIIVVITLPPAEYSFKHNSMLVSYSASIQRMAVWTESSRSQEKECLGTRHQGCYPRSHTSGLLSSPVLVLHFPGSPHPSGPALPDSMCFLQHMYHFTMLLGMLLICRHVFCPLYLYLSASPQFPPSISTRSNFL